MANRRSERRQIIQKIIRALDGIDPKTAADVLAELLAAIEVEYQVGARELLIAYLAFVKSTHEEMLRIQ